MIFTIQILVIIVSIILNGLIYFMLRSGILDLKYTILWIIGGFLFLLFSVFPGIISWLTRLLNISTPINLLFFCGIVFLIVMLLGMTIIVSGLKKKLYTVSQKMAILEKRLEDMNTGTEGK